MTRRTIACTRLWSIRTSSPSSFHPLIRWRSEEVSIRTWRRSFVAHIVSSPYRDKVIQTFGRYKTPLHMAIELPTLQAIKRFVAMGNGVALVPRISVESELASASWFTSL